MSTPSRPVPRDRNTTSGTGFSPEEKHEARVAIARAFQLLGLVGDNGAPICPECGGREKGKFKFFDDGGWKCHRRGCHGKKAGAVDLLMEKGGYDFPNAMAALLGRPTARAGKKVNLDDLPEIVVEPDFQIPGISKQIRGVEYWEPTDEVLAVYRDIIAFGDVRAAQEFFGTWHISPEAVEMTGAVMITNPEKMAAELTKRYGIDALVDAGVVKPAELVKSGRPFWLINRDYPVIEPHHRPDGKVVAMQFRASPATAKKCAAHKEYKAAAKAAELRGEEYAGRKVDYVPKFLSLRGAGRYLLGCGLHTISRQPAGSRIRVVEGFKDRAAALTMGVEAYAIPGVGVMPPEVVCALFKQKDFEMVSSLDADDAGDQGTESLAEVFERFEIRRSSKPLPGGLDVTDILVSRNAERGCSCPTCSSWRDAHPLAS